MVYETNNFENLLGLKGFSDKLLNNHFKLYQGYVTNTNKLIDMIKVFINEGKTGTPEFSELKRRFGWEFNGMRLHELYFGNLTKNAKELNDKSELGKAIKSNFGSIDEWKKDFIASGSMRGIGWVILAYDKEMKKMFNIWINEHDTGHFAGAVPLLVMDVFEHAFMLDYGLDKASYIKSFMESIDWTEVEKRYGK